jgi:hypothetical protein
MIGLVSMIGSWGSPEKAAIEALVVGIIATLADRSLAMAAADSRRSPR